MANWTVTDEAAFEEAKANFNALRDRREAVKRVRDEAIREMIIQLLRESGSNRAIQIEEFIIKNFIDLRMFFTELDWADAL